ncbi:MAG: hypothetical protein A2173_01225 [Planctomycetes bacterium RBG_13_44_8b]|nr:MAG: hypothetical protein A2173_01225 [Planctomycetes bacterium RBG_13_44_8b]
MALFKRIWDIFSRSTSTEASPIGPGRPFRYDPFSGDGAAPPNEPGVYFVHDKVNKRVYIGETNNLIRRVKEHIQTGKIHQGEKVDYKIANKGSSYEIRRSIETQKIQYHKPQRNQRSGGGGRKPR